MMKTQRLLTTALIAAGLGLAMTAQVHAVAPTAATLSAVFLDAGATAGVGTIGNGDTVTLGALSKVQSLSVSAVAGEASKNGVTASGGFANADTAASVAGTDGSAQAKGTITVTEGDGTDTATNVIYESDLNP